MGALAKQQRSNSISYQIVLHQIGFLLTGLCTTLGVQWLFYRGAASKCVPVAYMSPPSHLEPASMSLLPQLSNYTGMLLVGLFVPILLKRKQQMALQYKLILSEEEADGHLFKDHVRIDPQQQPTWARNEAVAYSYIIYSWSHPSQRRKIKRTI